MGKFLGRYGFEKACTGRGPNKEGMVAELKDDDCTCTGLFKIGAEEVWGEIKPEGWCT